MTIKYCRNCKKKNLTNVLSLGNIAFTGKFLKKNFEIKKANLALLMCESCKLVQLSKNFDLKYLYGPDYGYRTGLNKTMTQHMKKISLNLSKIVKLRKNDAVLDIASNDGTLLNFYPHNIITFGVDPILDKFKNNYKKINYSINNFFDLKQIRKKLKKKFKIITALSVFYDLQNPNLFLDGLKKLIADDGIILLEFADLHSILKYNMFDTICHEHLEYYSSDVLNNMLKKNNLRIVDIKINSINGGSKQYFICKKEAKFKSNNKKINSILKKEKFFKMNKVSTFIKFKENIDKIKFKLLTLLKAIIQNNKIVHGYGASTKGNVLLQYFGIDNKLIPFIAERNPKKYNHYTPGTNIKIISEKKSRNMKPDYYLVLPWHFKNEIIQREKPIIKKGTFFIFPLPILSIVKN